MNALRLALSRYEKVCRMQSNLDKLKHSGEVDEGAYTRYKVDYEELAKRASSNLQTVREHIKRELGEQQIQVATLEEQLSSLQLRVRVGELSPESAAKQLTSLQSRRDDVKAKVAEYGRLLQARNSSEVGGFVDVDVQKEVSAASFSDAAQVAVNEAIDKGSKKIGSLSHSMKGMVSSSLTKAPTLVERYVPQHRRRQIVVAVIISLAVVLLGGLYLITRTSPKDASKGNFQRIIADELAKNPVLRRATISTMFISRGSAEDKILNSLQSAGLITRISDRFNERVMISPEAENLIDMSDGSLHLAMWESDPSTLKVIRFTTPGDKNGLTVTVVECSVEWKPTRIATDPKCAEIRSGLSPSTLMRGGAVALEITVTLYDDGWHVINRNVKGERPTDIRL